MLLIKTMGDGDRIAELYDIGRNGVEVFCLIGTNRNVSRAYPCRAYKTMQAAEKYANKFINQPEY